MGILLKSLIFSHSELENESVHISNREFLRIFLKEFLYLCRERELRNILNDCFWRFQIQSRNRSDIISTIRKDGFILTEDIVFVFIVVCGTKIIPSMREDRSNEVNADEYKKNKGKSKLPTHDIFIQFINMAIFFESPCRESHNDKESKVDKYTIPDNTEGTDHEDKTVYTHEHDDFFELFIRFRILDEIMNAREKCEIHTKHHGISESVPEINRIEETCDEMTASREKIIESHQDEESECEESEDIPARSDEQEEGRYKCEKNIGDFREFSRLVFLEGEVCWKLQIVIDSSIIAEISSKIFILCLSTCCHGSCSFVLDDR